MNSLWLSLKRSDDNSAEFSLSLKYNGFEGLGRCFVDIAKFSASAQEFAAFPLPHDGRACVEGGYFNADMCALKQTHLHVSARPSDVSGNPVLLIRLAVPVDEGLSDFQANLSCVIPTTYEQLKGLSQAMVALADGYCAEYSVDI